MDQYSPPSYPPNSQAHHYPPPESSFNSSGQGQQGYNTNETYHVQPDMEKMQYNQRPEPSKDFDESFKIERPKFNDWPFAVFFLLVVGGFIAVAGITLNALRKTFGFQGSSIYDSRNSFTMNTNTIILFAFIIVLGIVLSAGIIVYARKAPRLFITTGLILNVILGLGTCIYYFVMHYYSAAIVFLVFTLLSAWCYWSARSRIPFSATVLQIAIDVMKRYPSTLMTSLIGIVVSGAFSVLFSVVIVATYVKYDPNSLNQGCDVAGGSCSQSKLIGVLVFVFFAGYYISEVIKNVIHVVISGIYGTWYYLANSDQGEPKHPALGALKRALTYCFGSICFGSLIVSIIQLIRGIVQTLKTNALNSGDLCAGCGLFIADMIIGLLEWMVRYFNHYAYCYVALYGKSYLRSAKDTFDLIRFKGVDALINDCFINTSLHLYALFVGYLTALLAYFYLRFTKPEYNSDGTYYAPVIAFAFLISGQITRIALTVIESGISTFFIALAKDPEVFQMTNRNRFDEIFRHYPQVLEKITSDH
ncbi:protein PNS1 [Suhomyces tanzawaensis NRRL Y-17324]|uniref:Protein PNS1 n=1 Tax=Suhomyces tanzawaensis NRRL Y-17324 TaxID=984487 RepID=A0A1E4SBF3_9ASCO|nr:protein PNS1 [Suhomyces tanzawaensis NRRL Y-17324]ODV76844.1 protein PNS1 [Suhomyces tanzawaensis NRRL Y-17324]